MEQSVRFKSGALTEAAKNFNQSMQVDSRATRALLARAIAEELRAEGLDPVIFDEPVNRLCKAVGLDDNWWGTMSFAVEMAYAELPDGPVALEPAESAAPDLDVKSTVLVALRDGSEEPSALVGVTLMSLRDLMMSNPISFYELVCVARDSTHKLWGNTGLDLMQTGLLLSLDGRMHESVRNIVKNATTGDGLQMALQDPRAETQPVARSAVVVELSYPEAGELPPAPVDEAPKGPANLTEAELALFKNAKSRTEWDAHCDTVKRARGGAYPGDWYQKVLQSGLAAQASARF
jgi:hypothetical protein